MPGEHFSSPMPGGVAPHLMAREREAGAGKVGPDFQAGRRRARPLATPFFASSSGVPRAQAVSAGFSGTHSPSERAPTPARPHPHAHTRTPTPARTHRTHARAARTHAPTARTLAPPPARTRRPKRGARSAAPLPRGASLRQSRRARRSRRRESFLPHTSTPPTRPEVASHLPCPEGASHRPCQENASHL